MGAVDQGVDVELAALRRPDGDDPAVPAENATSEFFAAYMAEAAPLLAGPPEVTMTTPLWTKGAPG